MNRGDLLLNSNSVNFFFFLFKVVVAVVVEQEGMLPLRFCPLMTIEGEKFETQKEDVENPWFVLILE